MEEIQSQSFKQSSTQEESKMSSQSDAQDSDPPLHSARTLNC